MDRNKATDIEWLIPLGLCVIMAGVSSSAAEFVPGRPNAAAKPTYKEWVLGQGIQNSQPALQNSGQQGSMTGVVGYENAYGDEYGADEGISPPSDPGLIWAEDLPNSTQPAPPKRSLQTIGIPEPIREHFRSLDQTSSKQMDPSDSRYKELPNRFHSAYPLDDSYSFSPQQRGIGR